MLKFSPAAFARRGARRIALFTTAGLLAVSGTMIVVPAASAGEGHTPGNCGEASLYYDSNSNDYEIFLHSYWGPISQATYAIWTDGLLEVTQGGGFELEDLQAFAEGHLVDPGINVHNVYVLGEAHTAKGLCAIYVSAEYTPFQF
jgi:hypothetical protein